MSGRRAEPWLLGAALPFIFLGGCAVFSRPPAAPPAALALAAAAGPLEAAATRPEPPELAEYRARAARLEPGYRYRGEMELGTIPWRRGSLGAVLLLPPEGVAPRGTILAWHGYLSYSLYTLPALYRIAATGWAVLALDLPGHGFSSGERGNIQDFSQYAEASAGVLDWIEGQGAWSLRRPYLVMGHSAGGAAAIESLLRETRLQGGILLAPLVIPLRAGEAVLAANLLGPFVVSVAPPFGQDGYLDAGRVPLQWVRALGRQEGRLARAKGPALPVLILHATADRVLDWQRGEAVLERIFPAARSERLEGAGHVAFFNRGEAQAASLALILDFLDREFPPGEEAAGAEHE